MVQEVTLQLSAINNVPGVRNIEDVTLRIPQVSDIEDIVTENVPSRTEIADDVADELDDILGGTDGPLGPVIQFFRELADQADAGEPLIEVLGQTIAVEVAEALSGEDLDFEDVVQRAVEQATGDLDIGLPAEIQVEVGGSLFSVNRDFIDLLATALNQVDFLGIDGFPDLPTLQETFEELQTAIEDLPDQIDETIDGIAEDVQIGLLEVLLGVEAGPDEEPDELIDRFLRDQGLTGDRPLLDQILSRIGERVSRLIVGEEAEERLREALED